MTIDKNNNRQAEDILTKYLEANVDNSWIKEEIPAVVTHWLHSPDRNPLLVKVSKQDMSFQLLKVLTSSGKLIREELKNIPFPPPRKVKFKFIDLFAGIGGFRIALQKQGGKCVFSSDWDKSAKITYYNNFGEVPFGNIKNFTDQRIRDSDIDAMIPDHDILAAGFPCQPFSRAGVSARASLGRVSGFDDENQGNLFFDIVRIVKVKKPSILFLENVKNLRSHDKGNTFRVIKETIEGLGYSFNHEIIDSSRVVPQKRERCYMVCYRNKKLFKFPKFEGPRLALRTILEKNVPESYTISDKLWSGHIRRTKRNLDRGAGFTAFEADIDKPSNTLVARYGKDGKECLIPQKGKNPRKLTPREAARLMGYPDVFITASSNAASYKQFGNSVAVPVVEEIAKLIAKDV